MLYLELPEGLQGSKISSQHWIKVKNPNAAAVKRKAEEDWGK
jgi:hypothetical protein